MLALWTKIMNAFTDEEKGASMVEYALLVVLIAIVALVAIQVVGTEVENAFSDVGSAMQNAGS